MTAPTLFLVTSHNLTPDQIADLKATFGVEDIITPTPEIAQMCKAIPATDSFEHISHLAVEIVEQAYRSKCNYLCVMGEPALVTLCYTNLVSPLTFIQATTDRISIDQPQADGSVIKTAVFKHVQWRVWG